MAPYSANPENNKTADAEATGRRASSLTLMSGCAAQRVEGERGEQRDA